VHGYGQENFTMKSGLLVLCAPQSFDVPALPRSFSQPWAAYDCRIWRCYGGGNSVETCNFVRHGGLSGQRVSGSFPTQVATLLVPHYTLRRLCLSYGWK